MSTKNTTTVNVTVSTSPILTIVGYHTRWDVGTKSRLVKHLIENPPAGNTPKEKYVAIATQYNVTYTTIHNWIKMYSHVCHVTQYALDGTLVISHTVVKGKSNQENTFLKLKALHKELRELQNMVEIAPYAGMPASKARRNTQQDAVDSATKSD